MSALLTDPILLTCAAGVVAACWAWWPPLHELIGPLCEPEEQREMGVVLVVAWSGLLLGVYEVWRGLGWLVTR